MTRCPPCMRSRFIAVAIFSAVFASANVRADIVSTFDSSDEGWTPFQNTGVQFGWISTGGNPGGHIGATDETGGWAYVAAPAKFLVPAEYGGTFSFDLRVETTQGSPALPGNYRVRTGLQGAGLTLLNELTFPTTSWLNYSLTLNELSASGWRKFSDLSQNYSAFAPMATQAEMQSVLAGLSRVVIATDYTNSALSNNVPNEPLDRTYIDNVRLSTTPVPEPTSLALLAGTTCMIVGRAARRRFRASEPAA